jgi:hypothetical protein
VRRKVIVLIVVSLITTVTGIGLAKDRYSSIFNDTQGHWSEEVVTKFALSRVIDGYADGSFRPETYVTKAELSRALVQVYQKTGKIGRNNELKSRTKETTDAVAQAVKKYYADNGFAYPVEVYNGLVQWQKVSLPVLIGRYLSPSKDWDLYDYYLRADTQVIVSYYRDVSPNDWYFSETVNLYELGIDWGENGFFNGSQLVTREEIARLLVENSAAVGEGEFACDYTDMNQCMNREIVERAIALGLMKGYADSTFRPTQPLTRAEAIAVLSNYQLLLGG